MARNRDSGPGRVHPEEYTDQQRRDRFADEVEKVCNTALRYQNTGGGEYLFNRSVHNHNPAHRPVFAHGVDRFDGILAIPNDAIAFLEDLSAPRVMFVNRVVLIHHEVFVLQTSLLDHLDNRYYNCR